MAPPKLTSPSNLLGLMMFPMLLALAGGTANGAGSENLTDALRLTGALKIDRATRIALEIPYRMALRDNVLPEQARKKRLDCVRRDEFHEFNELYSETIHKALTKSEISQALAFVTSDVGAKWTSAAEPQLLIENGLTPDSPIPDFTDHEKVVIERFAATEAGTKLLMTNIFSTAHVQKEIDRIRAQTLARCGDDSLSFRPTS